MYAIRSYYGAYLTMVGMELPIKATKIISKKVERFVGVGFLFILNCHRSIFDSRVRVIFTQFKIFDSDFKINPQSDVIKLDGNTISYKKHIYIMLNKPQGVVCSTRDGLSPTVLSLVPAELMRKGLFPAGRLDKDRITSYNVCYTKLLRINPIIVESHLFPRKGTGAMYGQSVSRSNLSIGISATIFCAFSDFGKVRTPVKLIYIPSLIISFAVSNEPLKQCTTPFGLYILSKFMQSSRITSYNVCYTKLLRCKVKNSHAVFHLRNSFSVDCTLSISVIRHMN